VIGDRPERLGADRARHAEIRAGQRGRIDRLVEGGADRRGVQHSGGCIGRRDGNHAWTRRRRRRRRRGGRVVAGTAATGETCAERERSGDRQPFSAYERAHVFSSLFNAAGQKHSACMVFMAAPLPASRHRLALETLLSVDERTASMHGDRSELSPVLDIDACSPADAAARGRFPLSQRSTGNACGRRSVRVSRRCARTSRAEPAGDELHLYCEGAPVIVTAVLSMPEPIRLAPRSRRPSPTLRTAAGDATMPVRVSSQRGFTLLELMVVVVILGILAALIVPKVMSRPDEARVTASRQDVASLMQALQLYRLDNLRYPTTEQGLQALVTRPQSEPIPSN